MEKEVAKALLEEKLIIVIEGETLEMKPPSIATLVLASKYISQLPSETLNPKQIIPEMIQNAHLLEPLGKAMAVMILGVKEFQRLEKRPLFLFGRSSLTKGEVLAEKINHANIKEVLDQFVKVLGQMNLTGFFRLTTFLTELNITKPTKKVVI